jgi:hypothetical protein
MSKIQICCKLYFEKQGVIQKETVPVGTKEVSTEFSGEALERLLEPTYAVRQMVAAARQRRCSLCHDTN